MPSLYETTIPLFLNSLSAMSKFLAKGQAFADENGIAHEELLSARLAPDMHPLVAQVQRASDTSRFVAVRVAGATPKPMSDDEKTFADLQARISATRDYLKAVPASAFDAKEGIEVKFKAGSRELNFTGQTYITFFAIPNFYFHVTTAYDILRHKGVPIGKVDFLGG